MDIVITNGMITTVVFGLVMTILTTIITVKVTTYIKKRDTDEREKMQLQKFYNMQLEAMVFAVLSHGEHKDEIKSAYDEKLKELLNEEKFLHTE